MQVIITIAGISNLRWARKRMRPAVFFFDPKVSSHHFCETCLTAKQSRVSVSCRSAFLMGLR